MEVNIMVLIGNITVAVVPMIARPPLPPPRSLCVSKYSWKIPATRENPGDPNEQTCSYIWVN